MVLLAVGDDGDVVSPVGKENQDLQIKLAAIGRLFVHQIDGQRLAEVVLVDLALAVA